MNNSTLSESRSTNLSESFALLGMTALAIRLVQGFILWGGASRRLFYKWGVVNGASVPIKMDPSSPGYVANKLLHAAPGSPLGPAIHWMVGHSLLLYALVWVWTLAELFIGVGLIFGLFTRLWAFGSLLINISLMVLFGWMGSTCVDEWTMAAAGFAMGTTLMVSGGGTWSLDHYLMQRWPQLGESRWMRMISSGALPELASKKGLRWVGVLGLIALAFTMGFYQYYRGAVISPLGWRVNFNKRDLKLSHLVVDADGRVQFRGYANQGPDTDWTYIVGARLVNANGQVVEQWKGSQLSALPKVDLVNDFTQPWAAQVKAGPYGLRIKTGAIARVKLPATISTSGLKPGQYDLQLQAVSGKVYKTTATLPPAGQG